MRVTLGVHPFDLKVFRRATANRIRTGISLLQTDLVSVDQVEGFGPLAIVRQDCNI